MVLKLVVFSLVRALCYARYSGYVGGAVCMQSCTRPSDATGKSERSIRNCIVTPFYRLSFPQLEMQVSIPPGLFSQVFRAHASMAL